MKMEITGNTYSSKDYDMFKKLEGNRAILQNRVKKIRRSIEKNGYIYNPIVVNEKYEIIDGQGRFEALRELDLPIDFVVAPGAGVKECVALNASNTNWTMKDYVDSYVELGFEDYIRLAKLLEDHRNIEFVTVLMLATGLASSPNKIIKEGKLSLPQDQYEDAEDVLRMAESFTGVLNKERVPGETKYYFHAVCFAYKAGCDMAILLNKMQKTEMTPATNVKSALSRIEEIYNKNLRSGNKVYLCAEYSKRMTEKYGWYAGKYGKDAEK